MAERERERSAAQVGEALAALPCYEQREQYNNARMHVRLYTLTTRRSSVALSLASLTHSLAISRALSSGAPAWYTCSSGALASEPSGAAPMTTVSWVEHSSASNRVGSGRRCLRAGRQSGSGRARRGGARDGRDAPVEDAERDAEGLARRRYPLPRMRLRDPLAHDLVRVRVERSLREPHCKRRPSSAMLQAMSRGGGQRDAQLRRAPTAASTAASRTPPSKLRHTTST